MKANEQWYYWLPVLLCALFFSSFAPVQNKEKIKGNGSIKKETRETSNFTGIETSGTFKVYIRQGNSNALQVEADDNLMAYIVTKVEGNSLEISPKKGYSLEPSKPINVYVTVQTLKEVAASGKGGFYSDGKLRTDRLSLASSGSHEVDLDLDADALELNTSGSGVVKLKGRADKTEIAISGSSNVDAQHLATNNTEVAISGSANVSVRAERKLEIAISGSGNVKYYGNATVSQSVSGRGTVKKEG